MFDAHQSRAGRGKADCRHVFMSTTDTIPEEKIFDVRPIYSNRHQRIFDRFHSLNEGDYFVLRNGHDPVPLRIQFEQLLPECFLWEYLPQGPDFVQVKITKLRHGVAGAVEDCHCQ